MKRVCFHWKWLYYCNSRNSSWWSSIVSAIGNITYVLNRKLCNPFATYYSPSLQSYTLSNGYHQPLQHTDIRYFPQIIANKAKPSDVTNPIYLIICYFNSCPTDFIWTFTFTYNIIYVSFVRHGCAGNTKIIIHTVKAKRKFNLSFYLIIYLRAMQWRHIGEWRYNSTILNICTG